MKFTFKKHPRATGLAAIGYGRRQSVDIKLKGKNVGLISAPNHTTKDNLWGVGVQVKGSAKGNPESDWRWVYFKCRFATEELARQFVTERLETALTNNNLVLKDLEG